MGEVIKIGPALPADLPSIRIDSNKPEGSQQQAVAASEIPVGEHVTDRGDGTFLVRNTDILGNIVETVMGMARPKVETVADLKARVKSSYVDAAGLTIENY